MTERQLIEIADKGYPDGKILEAYELKLAGKIPDVGDSLATFCMSELCETFDDLETESNQRFEAMRVMRIAAAELCSVRTALETV